MSTRPLSTNGQARKNKLAPYKKIGEKVKKAGEKVKKIFKK